MYEPASETKNVRIRATPAGSPSELRAFATAASGSCPSRFADSAICPNLRGVANPPGTDGVHANARPNLVFYRHYKPIDSAFAGGISN